MTLHTVAKHLQEHGRGPDDQLVHMSTKELAGLQALAQQHGGSLTQNPHTGLPEAGFLDSILPTVLGAAATFAFPEITPMMAGLGIGGIQALRTGDLGKGLMAGLGAWGGADMLNNVVNTGGSVLPEGATTAQKLQTGASGLTGEGATSILGGWKPMAAAAAPALLDSLSTQNQLSPQGNTGTIRPYTYAANPVYNSSSNPNPTQAGARPLIGANYQPGQDTSERTYFNPQYTAQTPYTYTAAQGGQVPGYAMGGTPTSMAVAQNATGANMNYPQAHNQAMGFADAWQTPVAQGPMGMADGGAVRYGFGGFIGDAIGNAVQGVGNAVSGVFGGGNSLQYDPSSSGNGPLGQFLANATDKNSAPAPASNSPIANAILAAQAHAGSTQNMAHGGIASLGTFSDGGQMLKGPGDGMSDSIPAQIGQHQPARLAEGEFVVPADVVSHLGNGSTDAGSKQLYKMMDRVRTARTGHSKQGKEISPEKYMPA